MIPGANILKMAQQVVAQQEIQYFPFKSRAENEIGQDVSSYYPAKRLRGSVQPVPRTMLVQLGLDIQKNYVNLYVSREVIDVQRDVAGDQFIFKGDKYNCLSRTAWHGIDGWDQVMAVQVPNAG